MITVYCNCYGKPYIVHTSAIAETSSTNNFILSWNQFKGAFLHFLILWTDKTYKLWSCSINYMNIEYGFFCSQLKKSFFCKKKDVKDGLHLDMKRKQNQCRVIQMICKSLMYFLHFIHGLRTPREEITFTARPKIHSHSQIFRYGGSIFCLPHRPNFTDIFIGCP